MLAGSSSTRTTSTTRRGYAAVARASARASSSRAPARTASTAATFGVSNGAATTPRRIEGGPANADRYPHALMKMPSVAASTDRRGRPSFTGNNRISTSEQMFRLMARSTDDDVQYAAGDIDHFAERLSGDMPLNVLVRLRGRERLVVGCLRGERDLAAYVPNHL